MRSIPHLAVDATDVFDEIAAAKHLLRRGRMLAARAEVLAAYQGYEDAAPEVGGLDRVPLTDLQKEAMRHAFTVETEPMTVLRGDLLKRISVARCPFCGISESSTLDHYLPKEQYPEFSVFPKNLVPSCAEAGVLGVVPGLVGTIQATEAIKMLLGLGDTLVGRLLTIDVMTMAFRTIEIVPDPECPACGTREITELIDYDEFCGGATTAEPAASAISEIQPSQLAERLESGEELEIIDVREPYEWQIGHIPGARLIPLDRIAAEIPRLDKRRETILYCKVGVRSMFAARQLADAGVSEVRNLAGGILRWIDEVDPTMTRY